jgi:hypothetical protein
MTALFATYLHPFPGREKEALELGMESAEFYGKLAAEGKCTPPEQFLSTATGKVYWFVKGQRDELRKMMESDEGKMLNVKCIMLLEGYTVELVLANEELEELFTTYAGLLPTG